MKSKYLATLSLFSTLIIVAPPPATCQQPLDSFLQCLKTQTPPVPIPISEAIYTPQNPSFNQIYYDYLRNQRFNTTESRTFPLVIVAAKHEAHVQSTVICAKSHRLHLRIRSGGHDTEGLSYYSKEPFVLLDMFNLASIEIDVPSETAWVGAGATLGEVYHAISSKSKTHAFPGGICFTVCTGGHFTGAGYGTLIRKYGLSVDNIIDARLVDVNGKILDRESMGEDLFWAIRGGGASFGVILSWKLKLVRVPEKLTYFRLERNSEEPGATDVVYRWQEVADLLPDDIFIRTQIQPNMLGTRNLKILYFGLYLGGAQALIEMMNKEFPELGLKIGDCKEGSWAESAIFWEAQDHRQVPLNVMLNRLQNFSVSAFKVKSDYVMKPIPKNALQELWKMTLDVKGYLVMQWSPYGGRMAQIPANATPFPHRAGYKYKIQYWFMLQTDQTQSLASLQQLYDFMGAHVSNSPRENFLNYRDLDVGTNSIGGNPSDFGERYFKGNFERLRQVKTKVDPENFFRNEQTIPPLSGAQ